MAIKIKITVLTLLSLVLISNISANEISPKKATEAEIEEYLLDEVTVTSDSSLRSLQAEVIRAEETRFEIFNKLNSSDDFDITCEWRVPTGSRLRQWGCVTGYMKKARFEDMDLWDAFSGKITPRSDRQLAIEYTDKHKALKNEMIDLALKHPELCTAMLRAHELRQRFEKERKRRFKGSIFTGHSEPYENRETVNEFVIWQAVFLDHMRGSMQEEIWARWDSWCKNRLQKKSYRKLWVSASKDKYADKFKAYVETIISGKKVH